MNAAFGRRADFFFAPLAGFALRVLFFLEPFALFVFALFALLAIDSPWKQRTTTLRPVPHGPDGSTTRRVMIASPRAAAVAYVVSGFSRTRGGMRTTTG
jgi:hypothetical protein